MKKLGILFNWNKSRPENRSLLPPREVKHWNCNFSLFQHEQQCERQESKVTTIPCWPLFQWITQQAKSGTPCCGKDEGPGSKIHPLSSKVIRRRNSHRPQQTEVEYKCQEEEESSSWKAFKINSCCEKTNEESSTNSKATSSCSNHFKSKWRIGLNVINIWPKSTCNFKSHTQNLKSLITNPSSWRWFQSSNSMFQDFLEDMEILKNMDAKDLNEYREFLLNEPLTYDRLHHYPKIVLRVFVYLLRNQKPPKMFRKKVLIQLCIQWTCKKKSYFCIFEKKVNEFLENGCKNVHLLDTKTSPKSLKNIKKWASMKESGFKDYSTNNFQASGGSRKELNRLVSDSKTIKLVDESMLEEEKQLVSEDEKCDGWCNINEDVQISNVFDGLQQETFCACITCSNNDAFCYGCMCTICKESGLLRDSLSWMKCKKCLHITHLQCAIKIRFVGFNPVHKLDGEYWCQSCEEKEDLVPYWESILQEASQCNDISRLETLLYYAMSILKDTKRSKYKDLQMLVYEAWELVANGAQCSDIQILIDIICSNFQLTNDFKSNYAQERNLQMHATNYFKKAEDDIEGVQETIKEVEAWKNVLFQTEEQLKRLKIKLELKTKNAILSKTAAMIAQKSIASTSDHTKVNTFLEEHEI